MSHGIDSVQVLCSSEGRLVPVLCLLPHLERFKQSAEVGFTAAVVLWDLRNSTRRVREMKLGE